MTCTAAGPHITATSKQSKIILESFTAFDLKREDGIVHIISEESADR